MNKGLSSVMMARVMIYRFSVIICGNKMHMHFCLSLYAIIRKSFKCRTFINISYGLINIIYILLSITRHQ